MNYDNTLFAGVCMTLAGSMGLLRHFLLEPRIETFPRALKWLLAVFFFTASSFVYLGLRFLAAWWLQEPGVPPQATPTAAYLAGVLLLYKASLLANVLRQHYPAQVWKRLDSITEKVKCSEGRCPLFGRRP